MRYPKHPSPAYLIALILANSPLANAAEDKTLPRSEPSTVRPEYGKCDGKRLEEILKGMLGVDPAMRPILTADHLAKACREAFPAELSKMLSAIAGVGPEMKQTILLVGLQNLTGLVGRACHLKKSKKQVVPGGPTEPCGARGVDWAKPDEFLDLNGFPAAGLVTYQALLDASVGPGIARLLARGIAGIPTSLIDTGTTAPWIVSPETVESMKSAMAKADSALGAQPANVDLLSAAAEAHLQASDIASAVRLYERITKLRPEDCSPWLQLSFLYRAPVRRVAAATKSVELNRLCTRCRDGLVDALEDAVDLPRAAKVLEETIEMEPDYAQRYINLAELRLGQHRCADALLVLRKCKATATCHEQQRHRGRLDEMIHQMETGQYGTCQ